jgi:hypothetical protein
MNDVIFMNSRPVTPLNTVSVQAAAANISYTNTAHTIHEAYYK